MLGTLGKEVIHHSQSYLCKIILQNVCTLYAWMIRKYVFENPEKKILVLCQVVVVHNSENSRNTATYYRDYTDFSSPAITRIPAH